MAADNDLEEYAIADLNQLESVPGIGDGAVNVIVLVDRIPGYSTADGDWKGTRLYKITYDSITSDQNIRSTRLSGMGLSNTGDSNELNMADPTNLSNFVNFVKTNYNATNNMLILWDHGSGWRYKNLLSSYSGKIKLKKVDLVEKNTTTNKKGSKEVTVIEPINLQIINTNNYKTDLKTPVKAVCKDVTSSDDMLYNSEVRTALTGKGLTVLGFDACLMGMIETAYELKDVASYMIASPEVIAGNGWDYTGWLTSFLATDLSVTNLYTTAVDSYATYYSSTPIACLAVYDLTKTNNLYNAYNTFATSLYDYMLNTSHTDRWAEIADTIINNTELYVTPESGGNVHLDIYDLANNFSSLSGASTLMSAVNSFVLYNWTNPSGDIITGNPRSHGIAVYFGNLNSSLNPSLSTSYVYGNYILFTSTSSSIWPDFLKAFYTYPELSSAVWASATTYNDPSISVGESEFYFIYVGGSGTVTATLSNYGSSNDLDLYLYDYVPNILSSAGNLRYSQGTGTTESVSYSFSNTRQHKGWYIIIVDHYSGSTTGYRLVITGSNIK
jgi:hypothetical protein